MPPATSPASPPIDQQLEPHPQRHTERRTGQRIRDLGGEGTVVLWHPHARLGPGGWSTFDRYLGPLTGWFAARRDAVLLVRPHPRLLHDLPRLGPRGHALGDALHRAAATHRNIVLDTDPDPVPAFSMADVMLSDTSPLISAWCRTGRPLCHLHGGEARDATWPDDWDEAPDRHVATAWSEVRTFLDTCLDRVTDEAGTLCGARG
jgi:hypothetical protein